MIIGERTSNPIKLGNAIKALKTSARAHTKSSFSKDPQK